MHCGIYKHDYVNIALLHTFGLLYEKLLLGPLLANRLCPACLCGILSPT